MSFFAIIPKLVGLSTRVGLLSSLNNTVVSSAGCNTCHRWYTKPAGTPGAGAGKGGGAGGSIREAGGGLGRFGTAQEEAYFMAKQKEELSKIKKQLKDNPELTQKKEK